MRGRSLYCWTLVVILAVSCSGEAEVVPSSSSSSPGPTASTSSPAGRSDLDDLPAEARVSDGGGPPRPPAYWAVWNSCAEDNRADEAAANGGAEAGWFLVDDILVAPGIQLGDYPLGSCGHALAVLEGGTSGASQVEALAAELLAAELNLNIGSETCPAAEEAAVGGNIILSTLGFAGRDVSLEDASADVVEATPTFIELLAAYNEGALCV